MLLEAKKDMTCDGSTDFEPIQSEMDGHCQTAELALHARLIFINNGPGVIHGSFPGRNSHLDSDLFCKC